MGYKDLTEANKHLHYINGTKLEALTQKLSKNNSSGIKGVAIRKIGNKIYYKASIQLARKRIEKRFDSLEEAKKWREEKEEELFKPLLQNAKI